MNENLGKIRTYTVDRETNIGYMLTDEENEYFLHRNETNFYALKPGEKVNAFLYSDKKGRIAATLYPPQVTVEKTGLATVVAVNLEIGAFLDIGISKDVLLSRDDLPIDFSLWPKPGDKIVCRLKAKGDRLVAKISTKDEILQAAKSPELTLNEKCVGYVYRITPDGINIVTENLAIVFIFHANTRKNYRLGEKVEPKILRKGENDYSGTLIEQKEVMIKNDAERILEYLQTHQGVMSITEDSDPAVIKKVFSMSKNAFKHALGNLYKEKKIEITEDKVVLL